MTRRPLKIDVEPLLTPAEVAERFRVDPRTVATWTRQGKLTVASRTLGGHARYSAAEINALVEQGEGRS